MAVRENEAGSVKQNIAKVRSRIPTNLFWDSKALADTTRTTRDLALLEEPVGLGGN